MIVKPTTLSDSLIFDKFISLPKRMHLVFIAALMWILQILRVILVGYIAKKINKQKIGNSY